MNVLGADEVLWEAREALDRAGLRGSFLVRDLHTGDELGIEPDLEYPLASVVKLPLAIATLEAIRRGELTGSQQVLLRPGDVASCGPVGVPRFRHPVRIAVDDLLYLSMCLSDNAAANALFTLVPPERVAAELRALGLDGIAVRHTISALTDTPAARLARSEGHLAHSLAIGEGTAGRGHRVPQLDTTRANAGSARACVDVLAEVWRPRALDGQVAARVRELLAGNVLRHRLAPDFVSDASTWSSKTGTMLNLRHEVGVVEHADGDAFAVAALTESRVRASQQPAAEAVMGSVARRLRDHLRAR